MLAKRAWLLLGATYAKWQEDKVPRMGAALAYYSAFSLAPLLMIAIVISGAVFGQQQAQDRIVAQIAGLIGTPGAIAINRLIDSAKLPPDAGLTITVASVGAVLLGALGVFAQLQDAFDTIWKVKPQPGNALVNILRDRVVAFGFVLAVGFLLLVSLIGTTLLAALAGYLQGRLPHFTLLAAGINLVLPFLVYTLLFGLMLKVMPRVWLPWRDIWPGAILTAALFTVGKYIMGVYLGQSHLSTAAGAAGSLLVVLIWVYFSAQILLLGAEFTQVYARHYGQKSGRT